jgi:hypothetical protein
MFHVMFEVSAYTEAAPGGHNDDLYLATADWAVVLDGVSITPGIDSGCRHTVRWYVRRLALRLADAISRSPDDVWLASVLSLAIAATNDDHSTSCDLGNPLSPAATVALMRVSRERVDWLVLGDAAVAWRLANGTSAGVVDDRADRLVDAPVVVRDVRRYDPAYVARVRNTPAGFWVAASDPDAAYEALTGSLDTASVTALALYSDGVTRIVDRYEGEWTSGWEVKNRRLPWRSMPPRTVSVSVTFTNWSSGN